MEPTKETIEQALLFTIDMLKEMIPQGLSGARYLYALSNMICKTYCIERAVSIIIIEQALDLLTKL